MKKYFFYLAILMVVFGFSYKFTPLIVAQYQAFGQNNGKVLAEESENKQNGKDDKSENKDKKDNDINKNESKNNDAGTDPKDQCKDDGWKTAIVGELHFKNQGDCVSYFAKKDHDSNGSGDTSTPDPTNTPSPTPTVTPILTLKETITVPANSPTSTTSGMSLASGKNYVIEASGTWEGGLGLADAEYLTDAIGGWSDGCAAGGLNNLGPNCFDLQIDNNFVDWGDFSSTHVYKHTIVGQGNTVSFRVFEADPSAPTVLAPDNYTNNTGSATVKIYESN